MAVTGNPINVDSYFEITRDQIGNRIGYAVDAELSPRIASTIDEYIQKVKSLIEPSYTYVIKSVHHIEESKVFINESTVLESNVISQILQRCNKVAVFALTIGNRLEDMTAQLGEQGLIVEAFILDSIGSSYTERAADFVHGIVGEMAHLQNLSVSRRFSPGYCDWPISQQKDIFEMLGDNLPDITLSADYMMNPEKSVSGIIGIGPHDSEVASCNPCSSCTKQTCLWRRA